MGGLGSGWRPGQMPRVNRFEYLLDFLKSNCFVHGDMRSINQYKNHTGVSEAQLWKDLAALHESGLVKREASVRNHYWYSL